jgi:hypothetical protein
VTTCSCRDCSCSEAEIAEFRHATAPIQSTVKSYDLNYIKSRTFYGTALNRVLGALGDWVIETGGAPLSIRAIEANGIWNVTAHVETF